MTRFYLVNYVSFTLDITVLEMEYNCFCLPHSIIKMYKRYLVPRRHIKYFEQLCNIFHCNSSILFWRARVCRPHCNENPIFVFLFWELRGLSLIFHVSVSDLYIPRIAHRHMNVEIGTVVAHSFSGIFVSNFRHWFVAVHSFAHLWFLRGVWTRTQSAAVASGDCDELPP
jgi:hypothetical protein